MKFFGRKDCKDILNAAKKKLKKLDMKQIDFLEDNPIFGNQILCTYYRVWSKTKRLHSLKRIKSFHYSGSIVKIKINENSLHCVKVSVFGVILVRIFPKFSRIWTEYEEVLRISRYQVQIPENAWKIPTRITPNTDTFYAVLLLPITHVNDFKEYSLDVTLASPSESLWKI